MARPHDARSDSSSVGVDALGDLIRSAARGKHVAKKAGSTKIPVNNIAFVIDRSGSMSSIRKDVVRVFNEQLKTIKKDAAKGDQETFVSLYTFNSSVDKPLYFRRQANVVKPMKSLKTQGGT